MRMRELTPGIVAAFAAIYLIWGSTYLAIKLSVATLPAFLMTGTRAALVGVILYAGGRWRGGGAPTAAQWVIGAVIGAFLFLGGHGGLS